MAKLKLFLGIVTTEPGRGAAKVLLVFNHSLSNVSSYAYLLILAAMLNPEGSKSFSLLCVYIRFVALREEGCYISNLCYCMSWTGKHGCRTSAGSLDRSMEVSRQWVVIILFNNM